MSGFPEEHMCISACEAEMQNWEYLGKPRREAKLPRSSIWKERMKKESNVGLKRQFGGIAGREEC